jgi:uncharacterized protein (TIGR03118 family)
MTFPRQLGFRVELLSESDVGSCAIANGSQANIAFGNGENFMSNSQQLHRTASAEPYCPSASRRSKPLILPLLGICLGLAAAATASAATPKGYQQTNLISNGAVDAAVVDKNFINPWGVSIGPDFWINTTGSGLDYVVDTAGEISFEVTIPPASGKGLGSPTGTVFTGGGVVPSGDFLLSDKSSPQFLFCSIDGTVSGWSGGNVLISLNNHKAGDEYTGMAMLTNTKGTFVLLANAGPTGGVQAYNGKWAREMPNAFKDPAVPSGYAPFGVHVFDGTVYVTFAPRRGSNHLPVVGEGKGFVDAFDETGKFISRAIPLGGKLNNPWGMAIAPATFGEFGGDVLVGNFGDGTIAAYNAKTWAFKGWITDDNGNPIANPGLWEIVFGQGKTGAGNPNTLYFAAGLEQETGGLFGTITVASSKVTKTKTTVTSDGNPDQTGQKVTFTALVEPASGWGEPEGHVSFTVDGKALSTSPVDSTAHAAATASNLAIGKHTVAAKYSGDANFDASSGSMSETIEVPTAATPIISPGVGTYATTQTVSITDSTPHATIYYTVDGSAPTIKSPAYSRAISVTKTTTVKAIAAAKGMAASPIASATYTIEAAAPTATPNFSPAAGSYSSAQSVTLSDTTTGAVIYYTTDGSMPTLKSPVFHTAISVSATMTINAIAIAPNWTQSGVATGKFTITTGGGGW